MHTRLRYSPRNTVGRAETCVQPDLPNGRFLVIRLLFSSVADSIMWIVLTGPGMREANARCPRREVTARTVYTSTVLYINPPR